MYRYVTIQELATLLKNGVISANSKFGHLADEDNGWTGEGKAIFVWLYQGNDHWDNLSQWYFKNILFPDRFKIKFKESFHVIGEGLAIYHKRDKFIEDDEWKEDNYREGYLNSYSWDEVILEFDKGDVEDFLKIFLSHNYDVYDRELWDVLLDEDIKGITKDECKGVFEFLLSHAK